MVIEIRGDESVEMIIEMFGIYGDEVAVRDLAKMLLNRRRGAELEAAGRYAEATALYREGYRVANANFNAGRRAACTRGVSYGAYIA